MISERLKTVASYVPQGAKVLDVGSDHAYLPIHLCEEGVIPSAIAGEVVKGPYDSAVSNVSASQLSDKIEVRLANGLDAFTLDDKVNCIVIAGMGGRLIADILANGLDKLPSVDRLVLQPNNREDELREWLEGHHFKIMDETIMTENDKIYEILIVENGEMTLTADDRRFGPVLRHHQNQVFKTKWQKEQAKLEYALNQVPEQKTQERQILIDKIEHIKGVLDETA